MKQRYGRIVNITSVVGASGNRSGQPAGAAAKAGVVVRRGHWRVSWDPATSRSTALRQFIETDMTATLGSSKALCSGTC
jgi:3-oxoacyl-[acyl-carrier protein] reductase